jgi:DNA modification methylase
MYEINKIYNIDYKEGLKNIENKSIDLLITDPPYLHEKGGMKSKSINVGIYAPKSDMVAEMSNFGDKEINNFLDAVIPKMKKINMYIFCSKLQIPYYLNYAVLHKLKFDVLIWEKKQRIMNKKQFARGIEYIIRIYQTGCGLNQSAQNEFYYKIKRNKQEKNKMHEAQKPVALFEELIELSSKEGDLILDPFAGSGTTAISCMNLKRNYILFEIDEKNYNIINERINKK